MASALTRVRAEIAARLRDRRDEIEQATTERVFGVAEPAGTADPDYVHGLRAAVSAALDYALESVEFGEDRAPPVPPALLAQARLAARNGVGVDTVLRRYLAGYSVLGEFFVEEVEASDLGDGVGFHHLHLGNSALLDRLLMAVSEEHSRELAMVSSSGGQRRLERVKRLLTGELIEASELGYELSDFHLGLVGSGPGLDEVVRELAARYDRRQLTVRCDADTVWAWLGGRREMGSAELKQLIVDARSLLASGSMFVVGEPAEGLQGWRLTHRQAKAILPLAREKRETVARYSELALLATVLRDEVMATSLRDLYLAPLRDGPEEGAALRDTLRAYFSAGGRISSTAAALGIARRTVRNRLRSIEGKIGRNVEACAPELQVALRLAELDENPVVRR